ncbi:hypothetical protein MHYP_G00036110 [Metynnis hypsauchen]
MGSEQVHASLERFSLPCCVYLVLMLETFNSSGCLKQEARRQGPGAPEKKRVMKAKGYWSTSPRREGYLTSQAVGVWRGIRGTHRSTFSGVGAAGEPGEIRRSEPSDDAELSALLSDSALTHMRAGQGRAGLGWSSRDTPLSNAASFDSVPACAGSLTGAVVKDIWNETERPRCEREMLVAIAGRNLSVAQRNQQDLS